MFQDRCYDRDNDITANFFGDNNQITNEMNMVADSGNTGFDDSMMQQAMPNPNMSVSAQPIAEPMKERCVHRNIYHEPGRRVRLWWASDLLFLEQEEGCSS